MKDRLKHEREENWTSRGLRVTEKNHVGCQHQIKTETMKYGGTKYKREGKLRQTVTWGGVPANLKSGHSHGELDKETEETSA